VLNECLGLYNKPKAVVHPGHKLTGPKEEEQQVTYKNSKFHIFPTSVVGLGPNIFRLFSNVGDL